MTKAIGILLTNTGTPESPSVSDVRIYLQAFLSDPRIVRIPRFLWQPLLRGLILPRRANYAAELYQKIWTEKGSPLRYLTENLAVELKQHLTEKLHRPVYIEVGMHYGKPSILEGLTKLQAQALEQLIVLPLFPQYSTSTTETARDQTQAVLNEIASSFITHYAAHPSYIEALAQQIREHQLSDHHLLFSFHGLPQRFADQGDPYPLQCQQTAQHVAEALNLAPDAWSIAYQSRFGYARWLSPYTFKTLQKLPRQGIRQVSLICPGFSVDCLETLEEIKIRGKEEFLKHGGESYHYIPALNDSESHVQALGDILSKALE